MNKHRAESVSIGGLDRGILMTYIALVIIGWMMIFAVTYNPKDFWGFLDLGQTAGKQLFFMVVCAALLFFILISDWQFWRMFGFGIYLVSLVLLAGTIVLGREVNGANAWYQVGGFSFQPSEIAKFATCLAMASYLGSTGTNMRDWRTRLTAFGIFLLPIAIILLQKDTGSGLVFFSFMMVLYREGLSPSWYMLGFGTAALVILGLVFPPAYVAAGLLMFVNFRLITRFRVTRPWWVVFGLLAVVTLFWKTSFTWFLTMSKIDPAALPDLNLFVLVPHVLLFLAAFLPNYLKKNSLIQRQLQLTAFLLGMAVSLVFLANFVCYTVLAPHQQARIKVWLKPEESKAENRGSAYNLLNSKMAIGSGGFFGKGYLNGNMTRLKYVPEQSTDFIFCTIGEQQGFIGVTAVVLLFTLLLYRITVVAERQRSNFSRLYAYCVAGIIFIHFIVNIGMTMGLFPIIGIPLPFISYGGSSLIGFTLMIGVLLKLDSHRHQA